MFRFRLEPLLDLRARTERSAFVAFERARRTHDDARTALARLDARLRAMSARLRAEYARIGSADLRALMAEFDVLHRSRERRLAELTETAAGVARSREVYHAAVRERLQIEVLRRRKHAEYEQRAQLAEAAELDEANRPGSHTSFP